MPLNFFDKNKQVALPSSDDFAPSGFLGAWYAQILFGFYAEDDLMQIEGVPQVDDKGHVYHARRKMGPGFKYYFKGKEQAVAAMTLLGNEMNPQETWMWQVARDSVLNFADQATLDKFSDVIVFDVRVNGLRSKKYRHEYQMIALPMAIAAYATALGYDHAGFDVSELLSKEAIFTDEFQARMIGSGEQFTDSLLWQRRAALWKSLGEEDAGVYLPAKAHGKLQDCLLPFTSEWTSSVWARVITVLDPRVDATYGDENKRLTLPGVMEFFDSEQAAKAAAAKDVERSNANKEAKAANGNGNVHKALAIPAAWSDIPEDWNMLVSQLKTEYAGKPQPVVKKQLTARASELAATPDELMAWVTA